MYMKHVQVSHNKCTMYTTASSEPKIEKLSTPICSAIFAKCSYFLNSTNKLINDAIM